MHVVCVVVFTLVFLFMVEPDIVDPNGSDGKMTIGEWDVDCLHWTCSAETFNSMPVIPESLMSSRIECEHDSTNVFIWHSGH